MLPAKCKFKCIEWVCVCVCVRERERERERGRERESEEMQCCLSSAQTAKCKCWGRKLVERKVTLAKFLHLLLRRKPGSSERM